MYRWLEKNGFVPGVPARNLSDDEWAAYVEHQPDLDGSALWQYEPDPPPEGAADTSAPDGSREAPVSASGARRGGKED